MLFDLSHYSTNGKCFRLELGYGFISDSFLICLLLSLTILLATTLQLNLKHLISVLINSKKFVNNLNIC